MSADCRPVDDLSLAILAMAHLLLSLRSSLAQIERQASGASARRDSWFLLLPIPGFFICFLVYCASPERRLAAATLIASMVFCNLGAILVRCAGRRKALVAQKEAEEIRSLVARVAGRLAWLRSLGVYDPTGGHPA